MRYLAIALAIVVIALPRSSAQQAADPLPSWNECATKKAIIDFVAKVTKEGSPDFVAPPERIATFDNDGTLWVEQPMYTQIAFALDRVKVLAPEHPEWKEKQPFKAVLEGDLKALAAAGEKGMIEIVLATHTGMNVEKFETTVKEWLATAKHPRFQRPYTECIYQPMLEVMQFLRANGFKTFIVSGGTVEFMRPFTFKTYGVPPDQVVGTTFKTKYEVKGDSSSIFLEPAIDQIDDKTGKPVSIMKYIGRRPLMAFGNSDGDYQMLEYTTTGKGPRFGMFVHHTDAKREYAYDRNSTFGKLDKGLDDAAKRGWFLADMKNDWKTIFPKP